MYGGHPTGRGSPPHAARARGGCDVRRADSLQSSISAWVLAGTNQASSTRLSGHRSEHPASQRSKRCVRCEGPTPECTSVPHRSSPRCEGLASPQHHQVPVLQTGTSAGVEPTTGGYQAAALPSELTCGGMKQRGRAVRARATRWRGTSAPGGIENPLSLHDRCFDLVTRPRQCAASNPPISFSPILIAQNDETPVGSAFRGLRERSLRDCHSVSPATHANLG
jgi:hypothetical protein